MSAVSLEEKTPEEVYEHAARALVQIAPRGWTSMGLRFRQIADDVSSVKVWSVMPGGEEQSLRPRLLRDAGVSSDFEALNEQFVRDGHPAFRTAQLTVQSSGKFDVEFTYED